MTEPTFDCRIWQHGVKWHWQIMNGLEQALASGVAESNLAARNAVVLQCLQRLGNIPDDPIRWLVWNRFVAKCPLWVIRALVGRNYVAFQAYSMIVKLMLVGLPMTTARLERYFGCPC